MKKLLSVLAIALISCGKEATNIPITDGEYIPNCGLVISTDSTRGTITVKFSVIYHNGIYTGIDTIEELFDKYHTIGSQYCKK